MSKIGSGFKIVAVMDGTTLNGYLRVEKCPLVQRYTKGSNQCVPDFQQMSEEERPVLVPIVKDSKGTWKNIQAGTDVWKYNQKQLHFGSDGLSTDQGLEGVFKRIPNYQFQYTPSDTKTTVALRVMKNLYTVTNIDNDRISCSCAIEVGGQSVQVEDMSQEVIIEETSGEPWSIFLNNADITEEVKQVTLKPVVYKNGKEISDLSGLNFNWYKMDAEGFVAFGTGSSKVVTDNDVHGSLMVKCELTVDSSSISATCTVEDYSDPLYVDFIKTGMSGDYLYKGKTAIITPVARRRKDGSVDESFNQWDFFLKGNDGNPLAGKGEKFTDTKVSISYEEVVNAGGGISGYAKSLKE